LSEPDRNGQLNQESDQSSAQNFLKSGFHLNRDKIRQIGKTRKTDTLRDTTGLALEAFLLL